ncbi:MAG TPA: glycosyltransferase family 2 protein [Terriglobales bacterium]|nr:glycosyltransferase family 2 protein [Terriglobales bacterium]
MSAPDESRWGPPADRPRVSLVVATVNRVAELERLLASLDAQTCKCFEVIVVDQNPDDRLAPVLQRHPGLAIRHLRCEVGLSRARNAALPEAKGDVIAFPDDDCWYPPQLVADVVGWFAAHPDDSVLFTGVRDPQGRSMASRLAPRRCGPCTRKNVLNCVVSYNAFLRRQVTEVVGRFDERIGVGSVSRYQSGEDLDYFLRPLAHNLRMWYEPRFSVYHPDLNSRERFRRTAYPYALGVGYVLREHGYSVGYLSGLVLRALARVVVTLCQGDLPRAYAYLLRSLGEARGYFFGAQELAHVEATAARRAGNA